MAPGDRPLFSIGYKYNKWKVLPLIDTEETGITKDGITYLSKYPGMFDNVAICPVACTIFTSKLFGSVNEFESHNKPRNYDLEMKSTELLIVVSYGYVQQLLRK